MFKEQLNFSFWFFQKFAYFRFHAPSRIFVYNFCLKLVNIFGALSIGQNRVFLYFRKILFPLPLKTFLLIRPWFVDNLRFVKNLQRFLKVVLHFAFLLNDRSFSLFRFALLFSMNQNTKYNYFGILCFYIVKEVYSESNRVLYKIVFQNGLFRENCVYFRYLRHCVMT